MQTLCIIVSRIRRRERCQNRGQWRIHNDDNDGDDDDDDDDDAVDDVVVMQNNSAILLQNIASKQPVENQPKMRPSATKNATKVLNKKYCSLIYYVLGLVLYTLYSGNLAVLYLSR